MATRTIGVREFKNQLSRYLKEVQGGSTIIVTDRKRPIARVVAIGAEEHASVEERMMSLRKAGVMQWSGRKIDLQSFEPAPKLRDDILASDILLEDRG